MSEKLRNLQFSWHNALRKSILKIARKFEQGREGAGGRVMPVNKTRFKVVRQLKFSFLLKICFKGAGKLFLRRVHA